MRNVKLDLFLRERIVTQFFENAIHFTPADERHYEVEPVRRLKEVLHVAQEGMVCLEHYLELNQSRLYHFLTFCQFAFSDYFHGVTLLSLITVHFAKEHFPETALANQVADFKLL